MALIGLCIAGVSSYSVLILSALLGRRSSFTPTTSFITLLVAIVRWIIGSPILFLVVTPIPIL